jgi:ABC-type xylose transport system permease subunit
MSLNSPAQLAESDPQPSQGWRWRFEIANWGSLPIVVGLIISWLALGLINDAFLSPLNLTNLMLQIASLGTLATGICLVLLLGEIDMSAGVVSGLSAALMAALNVRLGVPGPLAVLAGIGAGALVGLFQGLWITRLRIPSFIVTLAGMIGWWGVVLWLLAVLALSLYAIHSSRGSRIRSSPVPSWVVSSAFCWWPVMLCSYRTTGVNA